MSRAPDIQAAVTVIGRRDTTRDLEGALLNNADFSVANLTGAKLTNTELGSAWFAGTDLTGADLTGANLPGVFIDGAYFEGAKWPENTSVPEGWQREADSDRLKRADTASGSTTPS